MDKADKGHSRRTVRRDLVSGRAQARKRSKDIAIDLPRVGLSRDWVGEWETKELGDSLVEGLDLLVVAVKEGEERSLSSGRALDASESEISLGSGQVSEIPEKFLTR